MHGAALREELERRREEILERLRVLVEHESPSLDRPALARISARLAGRFRDLGAEVALIGDQEAGDHVLARFRGGGEGARPALLLGHFDTVWPAGTLGRLPFRREGGRAFGPGIYDMKAGLVIIDAALEVLGSLGVDLPRPVTVLLTSDEEVGSPTSRGRIEKEARRSEYVLVLEPSLPGGALKTRRKGVGQFLLEVEGRPAHAGVEPEKGISAVTELAHQVLALQALNDHVAGTSVNVGVVAGGTASNVIPAAATARIDARAATLDEARRVEERLRSLGPVTPGARVRYTGGFNRPPMERTAASAALFERARTLAREIGVDLGEGATGGGSDANFTAALGVATLDGLGADGAGAHAEHEQIEVASLVERALLLAILLVGL